MIIVHCEVWGGNLKAKLLQFKSLQENWNYSCFPALKLNVLFQGNDLKLGNIYDILGETRGPSNRYKSDIDSQAAQVSVSTRSLNNCKFNLK